MKLVVDHLRGSKRGCRVERPLAHGVRLGRHPKCEVAFDAHRDRDASSVHAEIQFVGRGWVLVDKGSSNGMWVDGVRESKVQLRPGQPVDVTCGLAGPACRIWIGEDSELLPPLPVVARFPDGSIFGEALEAFYGAPLPVAVYRFSASLLSETWRRLHWGVRVFLGVVLGALVATSLFLGVGAGDAVDPPQHTADDGPIEGAGSEPQMVFVSPQEEAVVVFAEGKTPDLLCGGFYVTEDMLATTSGCWERVVDGLARGRWVRAYTASGKRVRLRGFGRRGHGVGLIPAMSTPEPLALEADPSGWADNQEVVLSWAKGADGSGLARVRRLWGAVRAASSDFAPLPPQATGAPVLSPSGRVLALQGPGNSAVSADALRAEMRENSAVGQLRPTPTVE